MRATPAPVPPPHQRATLVDVARLAGVSTAAASKVIRDAAGVSDAMRAKVGAAIQELGYRPRKSARALRGNSYSVGVVLGDIENPFNALLLEGMRSMLEVKNYDVLIAPSDASGMKQQRMADLLIDHDVDGLILVSPRFPEAELERIAAAVPLVVVGSHGPGRNYDTVAADDVGGSRLVVEHLIALGHETIAFVSNVQTGEPETLPDVMRHRGFVDAMRDRGLESKARIVRADWSIKGGRRAALLIARETDVTAVHAGSDVVALGLRSALQDEGLEVPGHLSLVGYDNSTIATLSPFSLTSIDQQGSRMGSTAGELLLERISGRQDPRSIVLETRLRIRGSSSHPRH